MSDATSPQDPLIDQVPVDAQSLLDKERGGISEFMRVVREECRNNPPFARGFSLGMSYYREYYQEIQAEKDLANPTRQSGGLIANARERLEKARLAIAATEALFYASSDNPETIRGWYRAWTECTKLDQSQGPNTPRGALHRTHYETVMLGEETAMGYKSVS